MSSDDPQLLLLGVSDAPAEHDVAHARGATGPSRPLAQRRAGGLLLVPVAYTPDRARPICPACWSAPDIKGTRGARAGRASPRGWGVSCAAAPATVDGRPIPVAATIYRCANPACETALELHALMTGGYLPALLAAHRLGGAEADRYRAGRTTAAGLWTAADGSPRTARAQQELFAG